MANQEQLQILNKGYEAWNQWRQENQTAIIDLTMAFLRAAILSRANLSNVNLSGANLSGAILRGANLVGVNLSGADLSFADLSGADLIGAVLSGADLKSAYLIGADLIGANFFKASLIGANLRGVDLNRADIRFVDLSGANLSGADLSGANLSGANLSRANLFRASLDGADLSGADLREADLREAYLRKPDLIGVKLSESQIESLVFIEIDEEGYTAAETSDVHIPTAEVEEDNNYVTKETIIHNSPEDSNNKISGHQSIFFTTYHPLQGESKTWHTLLVYAHLPSALKKVRQDVERFNNQIKSSKNTTSKSSTKIARGTELTIVPTCEDVTFNPERISFKWMEDFHRAGFRFKADQSLSGDAAKGSINIYVGPLIIGTLKFAMLFNDANVDAEPVPDHEEQAKMYSKNDIFISYSRKDTGVARAFKNILEATGFDVFLDVDDIRSGQLWEEELKRRIERAKIFQIFWSTNYSQSENCKQEWEYALKQNKEEGYIRPVFWQKPLSPKPPEELNKFNFKYVELKIANSE